MKEYQPFAISNFRVGLDEAVEPWKLPRDAYQSILNAHLYRGVLEKIEGYNLYASMSYRNQIAFTQSPDGVRTNFTVTLTSQPTTTSFLVYGTIVSGSTASQLLYGTDASPTVVNLVGSGGSGTINLTTLVVDVTFTIPPPNNAYSTVFVEWDSAAPSVNAIMGIKPYVSSAGEETTLVFNQRRVGTIINIFGSIATTARTSNGIQEIPHDYYEAAEITGNAVTTTFTGKIQGNIAPGTVRFYGFTNTGVVDPAFRANDPFYNIIKDNGTGGLTGPNVTSGSINYTSGDYTITFTVAPANNYVFDASSGHYGDIFTGSISNFFTLVNYQDCAFFTNSVDPIFYYDGSSIHYLNTSLTPQLLTSSGGVPSGAAGTYITSCLHVTVTRERLLLLAPVIKGGNNLFSYIYWSVTANPFSFTNNEFLGATTSQPIRTFGYINTSLLVRFSRSERIFQYTGDSFLPFRFDSTNNNWDCDAPYTALDYDTYIVTLGRSAIVSSDGVNISRIDEIIPDFTEPYRLAKEVPIPYMSQTSIKQSYGQRFNDIKEGWICYNSGTAESTVQASNNILAYNYLDKTYAIYKFPFSCLGTTTDSNGLTWGQCFEPWERMGLTWASYQGQANALIGLGGDQFDRVYQLNVGSTQTVAGDSTCTPTPVLLDVITKNFNPFIDEGQLARLGYVDLFVSAYNTSTLRVQFYLNDELYIDPDRTPKGYYQENTLTFTTTDAMSSATQTKVWKRIYVGAVGKEHTIRLYQNILDFTTEDDQPIYIHAMVLYFKPAGRIFN